jgi:hypothetical protein
MMNPRFLMVAALACVMVGMGCSTAKVRVMPGEDGVNRVVSRDIGRDGAEEASVEAANEYCEKQKKTAVFMKGKDSTKYTGSMDENTRNTVRKASKAAMILGGAGGVLGGGGTQTAGAVLGGAGTVGTVMTSDRDYQAELEFKCQ